MRDPLHTIPLQGDLLQEVLSRFPNLNVSAVQASATLEYTSETITALTFAPLEEYKISRSRFRVIMFLSLQEMMRNEPPGPSVIAENLGVTRATMTDLLDGLERDGIVERRLVGGDRRAQTIHLTDAGRQLFDKVIPPLAEKIVQLFAPLSPDERQTLIGLLSKLIAQKAVHVDL